MWFGTNAVVTFYIVIVHILSLPKYIGTKTALKLDIMYLCLVNSFVF